ncbi:MAG: hypothetical protein HY922_07640 [Elusimicrobia bacterium]|nr:hypothetical protein [Elusimicrobiota bacterium]
MNAPRRRDRPVLALAGLLALASLACACRPASEARFRLQGVITASPQIQRKAERPETVLFIVAMNAAGIPVAVKRVLHPRLPLEYQLTEDDLLLPGPASRGPLAVKVHINTHGQAGITVHGDMIGVNTGPVYSEDNGVNVFVDKEV